MPDSPVWTVVLAAGRSTRMGSDKAMVPIAGEPMIRRVVRSVQGLRPIVVVAGANDAEVRAALRGLDVAVAANPHPEDGLASSLAAGIRATPGDAAVLVVLGDMPWMNPATLAAIVEAYREGAGSPIVVPVHEDRAGNPVLFDPAYRSELLVLKGDEGGRRIWRAHRDRVRFVSVGDPAELDDVDAPADLRF
ncbi:MAG: nucleotidyltransferase family protein [Fimbriimonadaceae bacterium]|nr:nucleotidyltransferase family protein [Fimbriimonadaceae bacterium]